ncbi:MAG TPA: histidinol-phosphate transaminase [Steroidobacteraceae bacterium]|jgi:histidinol-phosphate aminotransferase
MSPFSRRQFLTRTSASALAAPVLLAGGAAPSEAATDAAHSTAGGEFNLSMGFPEGALRLGFNENPLGPSQKAIAGAIAAIPGSYRYALSWELRPLIAAHHAVDKDWVLIGNGSTEVLTTVPVAFARDKANVVAALETWDEMLVVAENMGTSVKRIKLLKDKNYAYDVDGMLAAVDADTRVFMIISPNNPTGSTLDYAQLKKIADALPKKTLFVIDQAYADYLPEGKTGIDLVKEGYRNVLVTRTFSKAHAMAGLRCGYGIAHPEVLKEIAKFACGPGSTNMAVFGAVEGSLRDPAHIERSRAWVRSSHAWYQQQCAKSAMQLVAGPSPFALIAVGAGRGKAVQEALRARKVFINDGARWHLPGYIRVSYGLEKENQTFFNELTEIMQRKA